MKPITFKEKNRTLAKPPSMTDEECRSLDVFADGKSCLSCWRPSWRERFAIFFFGRVWIWVWSGTFTQPPVSLLGAKTAFVYPTVWGRVKAFMLRPVRLYRTIEEGGFYKLGLLRGKVNGAHWKWCWMLVLPYWYSFKYERFRCGIIRLGKYDSKAHLKMHYGEVVSGYPTVWGRVKAKIKGLVSRRGAEGAEGGKK